MPTINIIDEFRTLIGTSALDDHARQKYLQLCETLEDLDCQGTGAMIAVADVTPHNLQAAAQTILEALPSSEYGSAPRRRRAIAILGALRDFAARAG